MEGFSKSLASSQDPEELPRVALAMGVVTCSSRLRGEGMADIYRGAAGIGHLEEKMEEGDGWACFPFKDAKVEDVSESY